MLELSKVGCEDFASFSEERRRRAGGHFGSSPLIYSIFSIFSKNSIDLNQLKQFKQLLEYLKRKENSAHLL